MAEKARVSRLSRRSEWNSQITAQPLDDLKVKNILKTLKELVYSARGPNGRLILAAVQGHLDNYSDGGLQTALLLVSLVQSSLDLPIPRALLTQLYHHSLEILRNHLESCQWKIKLDIGNMKSMMTLLNSIIGTKPACRLSASERRHIGVLILQAFVKSLPSGAARQGSPERILILTCEGDSVEESRILEGVVLRAPDIATFQHQGKTLVGNSPKVALYNISMAGDTEEWFAGDVRTETAGTGDKFSITNAVLRQIIKLSDWLVAAGVRVIACQKCVHPFIKTYLRDKGAFVVDRLSILHISAVQRLTGATILSTFSMEISEESLGQLERIDHVVLNDKSYIHLYPKSSSSQINTLVLCSPDETSLEELKTVSQAAVCALYETLACPFVVPGAGCLDTHLASLLRQYAQRSGSRVAEEFACTKGQFLAAINNVARCLESLARSLEHDGGGHVTDLTNHHHWSVSPGALTLTPNNPRCLCGLVSRDGSMKWNLMEETVTVSHSNSCPCTDDIVQKVSDNTVLDIFSMKMNSFTTAIETANAILRVHCIVCSSIRDG
ncbi:molecular chaperone MKKS-like isoform X2 [Acropora palmata]|uniref:molecular chaperone MKKS-like isoform X2 n=1 Tax=Acropora palmata TaxID=6131 RepID=UPI003DA18340